MKCSQGKSEAISTPTSKDAPSETKGAETFLSDTNTTLSRDSYKASYNITDGTKVVPSCFKGTSLHLKVLPGCCPVLPPLQPSDGHTVMFKVPITDNVCPQPHPEKYCDAWDCDHVQMPCSTGNKCQNGEDIESKWELIKKSLSVEIESSYDLEKAILNYNRGLASQMKFNGLHVFFKEILSKEETAKFFKSTLPAMIQLALRLPEICTQPIPLLQKKMNHSITLSQKQISCLLCHAFLCTFPREKILIVGNKQKKFTNFKKYPEINFHKLYAGTNSSSVNSRKAQKLRCLINYFSRITTEEPTGTVTFRRQSMEQLPKWSSSEKDVTDVALDSNGVIEADGLGMLQVDFADKFVGGIVLDHGCVQEEIRFVICPELIICRLFTERLEAAEVVLFSGAEQYSTYTGYADSFLWNGNCQDQTQRDSWGRRCTRIVAMDALFYQNPADQFKDKYLEREVNKAYSGFYDSEVPSENLPAVATGNWGCGVFRGNPHFKFLIQLMAASETGRDMMYFTFNSDGLQKELENMYRLLVKKKLKVGDIWNLLTEFNSKREEMGEGKNEFYDFVCSSLST